MNLPISKLRLDGGTQPRAAIDFAAVDDYQDAMEAGAKFPPVVVFYDGTEYWVADGFHRIWAAKQSSLETVACDVRQGTLEDAQWFSFAANKTNGLRRTNEDKQRAVKAALAHPLAAGKSDRAIAQHVGVSHETVSQWRKKVVPLSESDSQNTSERKRLGSDGRTINTANIGKRKPGVVVTTVLAGGSNSAPLPSIDARQAQPEEQPNCDGTLLDGQLRWQAAQLETPKPEPKKQEPSEDKLAAEWLEAIIGAVQVINDCEVTVRDLVCELQRRKDAAEIARSMATAHDFLELCATEKV